MGLGGPSGVSGIQSGPATLKTNTLSAGLQHRPWDSEFRAGEELNGEHLSVKLFWGDGGEGRNGGENMVLG